MLHKDPFNVAPETFLLTQQLQALPILKDFYLVGGTALALPIGHRNSIDIDLFTNHEFETEQLISVIRESFVMEERFVRKNTIIGMIDNIKVDFIYHPYHLVKPPITEEGITYLSMEDIAAMKLHAIVNSGQRLKDFVDVYYLLQHFSIKDMLQFYEKKYDRTNPLIAVKALTFFGDIDPDVDPLKMRKALPLDKIKMRLNKAVDNATKVFG